MIRVDGREFDVIVGEGIERPYVCCCCTALCRAGLTYLRLNTIQTWTMFADLHGVFTGYTEFFFNPLMDRTIGEDCRPSPFHPMILEPTQERAIVESVFYREYVDEGILIESLQNYIEQHNNDCSLLYDLAPKYMLKEKDLTYWLNEAREESDMSMDSW